MIKFSALIILICSFFGIVVVLWRKIPLLIQLPKTEMVSEPFLLKLKNKIKLQEIIKNIHLEIFLQKLLSKFRIFTLKTDSKTANWLIRLRERSLKKKNLENDNYWQEVKKQTKEEEK